MALQGKGFMIWQIARCEGGNPQAIATAAKAAGLTHVLIKIADSTYAYNIDKTSQKDLVPPVVDALRAKGLKVWGWHYVYGYNPVGEAAIAVQRVKQFALDGYVIDAEAEYKLPGRDAAARSFMNELRKGLPNTPVALCSYRFPTYHPQLPWKDFLNKCDYNMPQVYWQSAHNPAEQLNRCVREFQALSPFRPIMPTGPVYKVGDWMPTPSETVEFLNTARSLNLSSANFFEWYYARTIMKPVWDSIAAYPWSPSSTPIDFPDQYINALNAHDASRIANLYSQYAIHITSAQSVQGKDAIQSWYTSFLTKTLPGAVFKLTGSSGTGASRHFTWTASSTTGKVTNGNDTIGLLDNKIAYHYSYFTVSK